MMHQVHFIEGPRHFMYSIQPFIPPPPKKRIPPEKGIPPKKRTPPTPLSFVRTCECLVIKYSLCLPFVIDIWIILMIHQTSQLWLINYVHLNNHADNRSTQLWYMYPERQRFTSLWREGICTQALDFLSCMRELCQYTCRYSHWSPCMNALIVHVSFWISLHMYRVNLAISLAISQDNG